MSSLFYDQKETHIFSDWLATSAFGMGVEDLNEFYVGVLPDLSDFLIRENDRIELNVDTLNEIAGRLQPLGEQLKKAVRGRIFVDLGAGKPELSVMPRLIAQIFGASKYIGVDLCYEKNFRLNNEFPELGKFESEFIRSDLNDFLDSTRFSEPVLVGLFGIEVRDEIHEAKEIRNQLADRLVRFLKKGDYLLLGAGTTELEVPRSKFKKIISDHYQFLFQRKSKFSFF